MPYHEVLSRYQSRRATTLRVKNAPRMGIVCIVVRAAAGLSAALAEPRMCRHTSPISLSANAVRRKASELACVHKCQSHSPRLQPMAVRLRTLTLVAIEAIPWKTLYGWCQIATSRQRCTVQCRTGHHQPHACTLLSRIQGGRKSLRACAKGYKQMYQALPCTRKRQSLTTIAHRCRFF